MSTSLRPVAFSHDISTSFGRLDFFGGVADYSGSLVLEMPTQVSSTVALVPEYTDVVSFSSPAFGKVSLPLAPLRAILEADASLAEIRNHLDGHKFPHWARYPLGCLLMLALHSRIFPENGFRLEINSTVPDGQGVSSSAALEIATLRTFVGAARLDLSDLEMAHLGQRAENLIVGASCGLMDQLACAFGYPGHLLPILCRSDIVHDPVALPEGLAITGWPTGVKHNVGASPYATARTAAFMGKRLLEQQLGRRWTYTSEIPLDLWRENEPFVPAQMTGSNYLALQPDTDDPLSVLTPHQLYPVRSATRFPIEENARAAQALDLLAAYPNDPIATALQLRALLKSSHDGYTTMGLGSPETDALVELLLAEPLSSGLIGGRISGGGSGGTVVVLHEKRALPRLQALAQKQSTPPLIR